MRINDDHESVRRLFAEHVAACFHDECEGLEIAGVDKVDTADADVAEILVVYSAAGAAQRLRYITSTGT